MDHIFFIHSSIDEHLSCFHVSAIANNAAVNIKAHRPFPVSFVCLFPSDRYPEVELLDHW